MRNRGFWRISRAAIGGLRHHVVDINYEALYALLDELKQPPKPEAVHVNPDEEEAV